MVYNKFKKEGYQYSVIERSTVSELINGEMTLMGDLAIYSQTSTEDILVGYEVVLIRKHPQGKIVFGKDVSGQDFYPGSSDWGKYGFTAYTLDKAREVGKILIDRKRKNMEKYATK